MLNYTSTDDSVTFKFISATVQYFVNPVYLKIT